MPASTTDSGSNFQFDVIYWDQWVHIEPLVAVGYEYVVNSGPNFRSVVLPNIGDGLFDLSLFDGTDWVFNTILTQGVVFDFGRNGVSRFRILGIETSAGLDPNDPTAFVTGLTFTGTGPVKMSQTPITQNIPEPATVALLGLGSLSFGWVRSRGKFQDKPPAA